VKPEQVWRFNPIVPVKLLDYEFAVAQDDNLVSPKIFCQFQGFNNGLIFRLVIGVVKMFSCSSQTTIPIPAGPGLPKEEPST